MNHEHPSPQPLTADDPRLSDWLDGRLSPAEAADVERLVAGSPELSLLVADLRRLKESLTALPATPPPATFVADVMAALTPQPNAAASGRARPMRRARWTWLAVAGALAAGVVGAVVITRPLEQDVRETAMLERRQARLPAAAPAAAAPAITIPSERLAEDRAAENQLPMAEGRAPSTPPPSPASQAAGGKREADKAEKFAEGFVAQDERGQSGRGQSKREQSGGGGRSEARAAARVGPNAKEPNRPSPGGDSKPGGDVPVVTMPIRGPQERKRLDALLAASGLDLVAMDALSRKKVFRDADADVAAPGESSARRANRAERIEVAGPPAAIAALVADLEALRSDLRGAKSGGGSTNAMEALKAADAKTPSGNPLDSRKGSAGTLAGEDEKAVRRLTILVIDDTGPPAGTP